MGTGFKFIYSNCLKLNKANLTDKIVIYLNLLSKIKYNELNLDVYDKRGTFNFRTHILSHGFLNISKKNLYE